MPIDIQTLLNIFTSLRNFLSEQDKKDVEQNERLKIALRSLMTASNETRAYLTGVKVRVKGNPEIQKMLAKLWVEASVQILEFNRDLARLCNLQGKKWSDPQEWTQHDINNAKVILRVIDDLIAKLLDKKPSTKKKEQPARISAGQRKAASGGSPKSKKRTSAKRSSAPGKK